MKPPRSHFLLAFILLLATAAFCQSAPGTKTVLVLPFDNSSHQPSLEWIGEAFPELVGQRLASPSLFVISRDDRQYAFDRMGIPVNLHASRATLYRIAGQLDADYIVLGSYSYDGANFTARAQLLDMKALHLLPEQVEHGPLDNLIAIQSALAWDLLRQINPQFFEQREAFVQRAPAVRLNAFENFIRAVATSAVPDRIHYLKTAISIDPSYLQAEMLLGKSYFAQHEYEQAANWFSKLPPADAAYSEANFLLGLCQYYLGHFDRAFTAFSATAERVPLTEVLNNLGVVESRRSRRDAADYLQKAVDADPSDPDYHFNLAIALYRKGDITGAQRQLRETLSRKPNDGEARRFQEALSAAAMTTPVAAPIPLSRIKQNYDESSYRQLALELQNAIAESIGKAKPGQRATLHIERAREFLASGLTAQAESQFRSAIEVEANNAEAHAGLGRVLYMENKFPEARREALLSLRYRPTAEAYLVLSRCYLHDSDIDGAEQNLQKARALEPANVDADALEAEIANHASASSPAH